MNWFQRYGMPGAYFLGLVIAWIWAIYPSMLTETSLRYIGALFAASFIPVGYIVFATQQLLYLKSGSGPSRKAKEATEVRFPSDATDESSIETYTLLGLVRKKMCDPEIKQFEWIREFIRKRMDVVSINFSFIVASGITMFVALITILVNVLCYTRSSQISCRRVFLVLAISIIIFIIMLWNRKILLKQVDIVLKEVYRRYCESL